ncbi:MAG: hypothetical protein ABS81_31925 [Pseudonocardia sp. SCN 72-86]|nr:MAG: hypothetical protein ABS81_31925 [Pseudonocardia sp. SCN 72-86]
MNGRAPRAARGGSGDVLGEGAVDDRGGQREDGQQHPGGREPGAWLAVGLAVDVDEERVGAGGVDAQPGAGGRSQRGVDAHGHARAGLQRARHVDEGRGDGVGAGAAFEGGVGVGVGAQRVAALQPDGESGDGQVPGVGDGSRHCDDRRSVGGHDPGGELVERELQRRGRGVAGGRCGGPGERAGEEEQRDRDQGRDRPHADSSSNCVARRISRRSSA